MSKRADITRYRCADLILHVYSDAFEWNRFMIYGIALEQKWYRFCNINFALFLELLSFKQFSQNFVYKTINQANYL